MPSQCPGHNNSQTSGPSCHVTHAHSLYSPSSLGLATAKLRDSSRAPMTLTIPEETDQNYAESCWATKNYPSPIHISAAECDQASVHSCILGAEVWAVQLACQWPRQILFLKANIWWGHWFVPNNTLSILYMGPRWVLPLILKVTTGLQFLTQNTKGQKCFRSRLFF